jgi:hypothetical protein
MHPFQSIANIKRRFKVVEELMNSKFIEMKKKRSIDSSKFGANFIEGVCKLMCSESFRGLPRSAG